MVKLVGLDDPRRNEIEGQQWNGGVIDESSDVRGRIFDERIAGALTHRSAWCMRIGVPKRHGVGAADFRSFCESAATGARPDAAAFRWKSDAVLSDEQLAFARQTLDAKDYREHFEGDWETAGGGVFYAFDSGSGGNVQPCRYDPDAPLVIGCDFNIDPMAWVFGHRYPPNRMEWFDELWMRDTHTQAALDETWRRYSEHRGGFEFYPDASAKALHTNAPISDYTIISNDRRFADSPGGCRIYIPPANPPVPDRISACNAMWLNAAGERRMFIDPRCVNTIEDIRLRHYRENTTEIQDEPIRGHASDAFGYPVYILFPIGIQLDNPVARLSITAARPTTMQLALE